MFDIGFSELLLVGLVALVVLGPERLPGAARTAGLWIGRIKRSFNTIKQQVEQELGTDEIRRQLHNEQILQLEREMAAMKQELIDAGKLAQPSLSAPSPANSIAAVASATATAVASSEAVAQLAAEAEAPAATDEPAPVVTPAITEVQNATEAAEPEPAEPQAPPVMTERQKARALEALNFDVETAARNVLQDKS